MSRQIIPAERDRAGRGTHYDSLRRAYPEVSITEIDGPRPRIAWSWAGSRDGQRWSVAGEREGASWAAIYRGIERELDGLTKADSIDATVQAAVTSRLRRDPIRRMIAEVVREILVSEARRRE